MSEALCKAAEKGDLDGIRRALEGGAAINGFAPDTYSALCYATMYGHLDAVKLLLAAGANVNHRGSYGRRPLHYAKRPDIAAILIEHGAEVAALDDGGDDVLRNVMTRFDAPEMIAALLDLGVPLLRYETPPTTDYPARSHLQWAVYCKLPNTVQLLLARGCDPNEYATSGDRVIFHALGPPPQGNDIARILIEAGARADDSELMRLLCGRKDPGLVALALAHGALVNTVALEEAAYVGDLEILTILLEHPSADVNAASSGGRTALMAGARAGKAAIVELLLRCGATPTLRDRDGATALHHAAVGRNVDICRRLVAVGCQLDEDTAKGWSPLEYAADRNAAAVVEWLLEGGFDPDHRTHDGKTALMIAAAAAASDVRAVLAARGADRSLQDSEGKTENDYVLARETADREEEERELERWQRY